MKNADYPGEFLERIRSLHRGLEDLYKDMWERLNEDRQLYQEDAAIYFKLVMAPGEPPLESSQFGLSVLEMMIASHPKDA